MLATKEQATHRAQPAAPAAAPTAKEQAAKEQTAKEQAAKEQAAKEQAAKEQAAKEQAAKEQAAKEQAAKEQAAKEQAAEEHVLQDQILTTVQVGQEAALRVAKGWVETVVSVTPNLFDAVTTPPSLDDCYDFAERLWSTNREFVVKLFEIASDFGKSWPASVKR